MPVNFSSKSMFRKLKTGLKYVNVVIKYKCNYISDIVENTFGQHLKDKCKVLDD